MSKIFFAVLVVSLVAMPSAVTANADGHTRSIADVVSEIAESQNVSSQNDISCDVVMDDQFEELGDAVMQAMIGDDEQHELMDNMMGGEGSESLRSMHIAIGQRYLGCAQGQFGTMGMMGGMMSMMGSGWQGGGNTMMGNFYNPWGVMSGGWGVGMFVFWIIVTVGVVLLVKWLIGQHGGQKGKDFLDILKERYAKGEISKDEFEAKRKDLV